jgi:hypothetical protein
LHLHAIYCTREKTHHLVEGKKALNTFVAKENTYSATTVFPADVWAGQKALNTFVAKENAYSATTVFPADVWAAKKTDSPFSR